MKKALYALLICSTLTVALPSLSVTSLAAPASSTEAEALNAASAVIARKPITEWRYKIINGELYKRLYDTTNKIWLTDWIKC